MTFGSSKTAKPFPGLGSFPVPIGVILELYWGFIGIMGKKMEIAILDDIGFGV